MTFEEKNTLIDALVTTCSFVVYVALILGRARSISLHEVPYASPMLSTIGGAILASIAGRALVSNFWPQDGGRRDVRDREIARLGEHVGQSFVVIGAIAALVMSMAKLDHFWIAHAVYLGFVLSALLGSATRLLAYRRGFQSC